MAYDSYIAFKNPDIQGESTRKGFEKQIELDSFHFDVENPTTIGSATGGAGAGKVKFNTFTITKKTESSTPQLYQKCCMGAHFEKVILTLLKASGDKGSALPFLTFDFRTAFVTKVDWSGGKGNDETPVETITFVYGSLGVTYTPQSATGAAAPKPVAAGWSQIRNSDDWTT
jgi:type VI secretion system secreted protein Hcp